MSEHVWVRDNGTGHQFPLLKSEAEALGDGVRIDAKHPTRDAGGELLHPVYKSSVSSEAAKKSGQAAPSKEK